MSRDLDELLRWEGAGGTWQLLDEAQDHVEIALMTCDGGEEMGRLRSGQRDVREYVLE